MCTYIVIRNLFLDKFNLECIIFLTEWRIFKDRRLSYLPIPKGILLGDWFQRLERYISVSDLKCFPLFHTRQHNNDYNTIQTQPFCKHFFTLPAHNRHAKLLSSIWWVPTRWGKYTHGWFWAHQDYTTTKMQTNSLLKGRCPKFEVADRFWLSVKSKSQEK